jgi:MFS transporter, ACS family, aldohexuronate transporter
VSADSRSTASLRRTLITAIKSKAQSTLVPGSTEPTIESSRWVVLWIALAIQTANSIVAASLTVLLPLIKSEFHLTFAQAGVLANFSYLGGFFTLALAGWAVDAFGDRVVLVVGALVTGFAAVACALAPTFVMILVALLIMGAGLSTPTPAGSIAVRSAFPLRLRGMAMGIRQTGMPLGSLLAALALPSIALWAGWRTAVAAAGAVSIVAAIVGLRFYRSKRLGTSGERGGSLLHILTRDITVAAISGTLMVSGQMCLLTYLIAYLIHDRHLSITAAAVYLALASLAGVFGRVFWGVVSDRLLSGSRRRAVLLAGATGAAGSLALAILPSALPLPVIAAAVLVCATGAVGWNGVQVSFLSELARPGTEGRSVGVGQTIQQPGILIGPFLFGLVVDMTGSFRPAWALLAGFLVLAMLIMSAAREVRQPSAAR